MGVTILVHGLVVTDEASPPLDYWGRENLSHLLARFGSGLVWLYNPDTRLFENVTYREYPDETRWNRAFAGQQVLLFDWTAASGEVESGQAEAAADELFAALLAFRVDGEPIIALSPPYAQAVRPLHFIGHSRGTVVVSECVQRLGRSNVPVNYVTYLDPHDFGQPGIPNDEFFHDPAVQVWHNVDHADAFFQKSFVTCINPHGRRLEHLNGIPELQRDLTNLQLFDSCEFGFPPLSPHGRVKEYYWATVACNAGSDPARPGSWFSGNGSGHGFDRWFQNGGYDQPRDERITRINAGEAGASLAYYWPVPDERGGSDRNDVPPIIFNGDFELPDLDGGIGFTQANSLAGWSYYGGGGRATVRESGGNHALELSRQFVLEVEAAHNRFYLPKTATEIRFAYWGRIVPPLVGTHTLEVLIGNRLLRAFTVAETSGFQVRTASLTGDPDLLGGANKLTFRLKTNSVGISTHTVIWLDNISIFEGRTANRIVSFDRAPDGKIHLKWESWPPRSYQLEAALNGLSGAWIPIDPLIQRASSGTVVIEHPGAPSAFYRLKLSP